MALKEWKYCCGNPVCGNISTARLKKGEAPRERHRTRCSACRKMTWHWLWVRFPITGRSRREAGNYAV